MVTGETRCRNPEPIVEFSAYDMFSRLDAHLVQLVGGGFQFVDLAGAEAVIGGFVPVGLGVDGVVGHAVGFDLLLPVEAGRCDGAFHGQLPPEWKPPRLPKPPRETLMVRMERLPWPPLKTVPERKTGPKK